MGLDDHPQTGNLIDEHAAFLHDGGQDGILTLYEGMIGGVKIPEALRHVTEVVQRALEAERATTYLVDKSTHELQSVAFIGNVARTVRVPIESTSLAGYCALSQRAFLVEDAYGDLSHIDPDLKFDRSWDEASGFHTEEVMCAPAVFRGETLGVVQVINKVGTDHFTADDLHTLERITRLVSYSLYHAQLYDELATLKYLKKEEAKFMRTMVHELKSPVAAAKMTLDTEAFLEPDNTAVVALADSVGAQLDRLIAMIGDVMQFSQIRGGSPLGQVDVFDLTTVVKKQCQTYEEQARLKGLTWTTDLPCDKALVRFDERGLALVVSNLISNAVKYTETGGVTVSLHDDGEAIVFRVSDTGIGVPTDDIPHLFSDFYRATNARQKEIEGSGVGLAGVKELAERFGALLTLDSVEDEGSTFTVQFQSAMGSSPS